MPDLSELDAQIASAAADLREHESLTHRIAGLDTTLHDHREHLHELHARISRAKETVSSAGLAVSSVAQRLHDRRDVVARELD